MAREDQLDIWLSVIKTSSFVIANRIAVQQCVRVRDCASARQTTCAKPAAPSGKKISAVQRGWRGEGKRGRGDTHVRREDFELGGQLCDDARDLVVLDVIVTALCEMEMPVSNVVCARGSPGGGRRVEEELRWWLERIN